MGRSNAGAGRVARGAALVALPTLMAFAPGVRAEDDLATAVGEDPRQTLAPAAPAAPASAPLRAVSLARSASLAAAALAAPGHGPSDDHRLGARLQWKVIELPPETGGLGPPPKRAHHAISMSTETPKYWLRGLGLDATDCAARFRLPSKLKRGVNGMGPATGIEVTAQLGMACHF